MNLQDRNVPLGYLRTFLTVLVVAHHAVLAYHPYAPPAPKSLDSSLIWGAFPIVDAQRWPGIELFVAFNDGFFMALMFLISGVFAWSSLVRKGAMGFVRDRARTIGLPFLVSAGLLAPLAYYPTYLALQSPSRSFWREWLSLGSWPAGPAWFLWVLLAFAGVAAAVYAIAPNVFTTVSRVSGRLAARPIVLFGAFVIVSAIAYLPMAAAFTPMEWAKAGPFFVQISRLLLYGVYFIIGAAFGALGVDRGILAADGKLARRWPLWIIASLVMFAVGIASFLIILSTMAKGGPGPILSAFGNLVFVVSCGASSFAFLAVFLRFAKKANRIVDNLSANAFGIYLLHYFCVSWLQLALLDAPMSGPAKGTIVFVGALLASWAMSAAFRSVRRLARGAEPRATLPARGASAPVI
ncbi:MAG TPA: acyltransferase [Thermoanaerobaculia bacterium]|nr:acyltransferase [Thermoanaerobaculia bacterium]